MTTTKATIGEINRVGVWALRGAGFPLGVADRGVHLLSWTEAVMGSALFALRRHDAMIADSASREPCGRSFDPSRGWLLRANGKSLIEVGPTLVDLAWCGHAMGSGHAAIFDIFDMHLAPSLVHMASRSGRGALAIVAPGATGSSASESPTAPYWLAAFADDHEVRAVGAVVNDPAPRVPTALTSVFAVHGHSWDIVQGDIETAFSSESRQIGYIGLSLLQPSLGLPEVEASLRRRGLEVANWTARYAEALRFGIDVATEDHQYLYELERRAWAPTSERSRKQAAF